MHFKKHLEHAGGKTTQKQVEANRRNGKKTQGPISERGKRHSSANALKHGILSREVVIRVGDGRENAAEIKAILSQVMNYYPPKGPIENMLVDLIVSSFWRLRRALKREVGLIRQKLDSFEFDQQIEHKQQIKASEDPFASVDDKMKYPDNSAEIINLIALLVSLKKEVVKLGHLAEVSIQRLEGAYKNLSNPIVTYCIALSKIAQGDEETARKLFPGEVLPPEKCKLSIREKIGAEIMELRELQKGYSRKESFDLETGKAVNCLPDSKEMELLMRYEARLENKLYKAIHELQRVQGFRLGIKAPLPIAVDL